MADYLEIARRALAETVSQAALTGVVKETMPDTRTASPMAVGRELELKLAENAVDWVTWKAAMLNRLFQEQSVFGEQGRITAATVRHGEALLASSPEISRRTFIERPSCRGCPS